MQGPRGVLPVAGMYSVSVDRWNAPPSGSAIVNLTDTTESPASVASSAAVPQTRRVTAAASPPAP